MKFFITMHCPTLKSRSEFLTLRMECLKYQGAYIKQKYNLHSLLVLYLTTCNYKLINYLYIRILI